MVNRKSKVLTSLAPFVIIFGHIHDTARLFIYLWKNMISTF